MNATEYAQIETLATEIADSAKLPDALSEVLEAGLEQTRPPVSPLAEMVAEAQWDLASPASWAEALGTYGEDVHPDDWR